MNTDPELIVLDALRQTCVQTRRFNSSADVCAVVLKHERQICAQIERRKAALSKLEQGAQAATPEMAAA